MSWQTDLIDGLARDLDTAGVGTYDPDGTAGNIVQGAIPAAPDQVVGITSYRVAPDDPAHPTTEVRVQFYLRAPYIGALNDLDATVDAVVNGMTDRGYGQAHVTQARSWSSVPMGRDDHDRPERALNYRLDLDIPATALRRYQ